MFLSKSPSGIYYLYYQDSGGRRRKVTTKTRLKTNAIAFLRSFQLDNQSERSRLARLTLDEFLQSYLSFAKSIYAAGTYELHKLAANELRRSVGNPMLHEISAREIDSLKAKLIGRMAPVTVNIRLKKLKAIFNTARRWKLIDTNPMDEVRQLPEPEPSPEHFRKEDLEKLLATVRERWLREIVVFAALTGLRRGEIVNLRWRDIDLERKLVLIRTGPTFRSKQGKRRNVPLGESAFYIVHSRVNKELSEYVFTLNGRQIHADWISAKLRKYIRLLGLNGRLHFHSLRHTFATWLVQSGVSIFEVQKLLGHSTVRVTEIYSHLATSELHNSVNKLTLQMKD